MSYKVIARKWRPQNFEEIIHQDHVSRTLKNSITGNRISHAYLFSGPRGVGKTTMARVLAKALNCLSFEKPTPQPCGTCDNCIEIREGVSFDVIEIDGASNRGIEDVRELRENVNFAPLKSRYKVYIIDEVHMLTKEAFNALLKTLEEPPPHVVFVFATTEIHQIPDTILSRCQKFFFKKIQIDVIVNHLKHIVEKEGYNVSPKALYPIARTADGSMRDAQSLLDQVISFSDSTEGTVEISEDDALSILGIVTLDSYTRQLQHIIDDNAQELMKEVDRISNMGFDIPRYIAGFIDILRIIRLIKNKASVKELLGFSESENEFLVNIADSFFDEELSTLYHIAVELQGELRYSINERINLEMAFLDMTLVKKTPSLAAIIQKLEKNNAGSAEGAGARKVTATTKKLDEPQRPPSAGGHASRQVPGQETRQPVRDIWNDFLISIQNEQQYLFSILKSAAVSIEGNTLKIAFPGENSSIYNRVLDAKKQAFVKEKIESRTGQKIQIQIETAKQPRGPERSKDAGAKITTPGAARSIANEPDVQDAGMPEPDDMTMTDAKSAMKNNPTVDKIKNKFLGEIIDKGEK